MCGLPPESESAQRLSGECEKLEDPEREAEQDAYIDEALIAKIYALIEEEPVKPSVAEAPQCVQQQGNADKQTESRAAKRRRRRKKKKVQHEEKDGGGEKSKAVVTPAAVTLPKPEPQSVSRKSKEPRRGNKCHRQEERNRVRLSWQENTVKLAVPVPPNRRRHVIGTRGNTIRELQQQYPTVRVSVPRPQDLTSREVIIVGPKTQADAVALQITRRLQAVEDKLREAEQRRQERKIVSLKVEVAPRMRRLVVGPGGETLRKLAQEHPAVSVTVPSPSDTQTASVTIRGPRLEAAVVADCVKACVQAAGQRQPNKRKQ
ncbi:Vigilin [Portunus trituberculatus]|uniref:Vigilin n=1 Tax=Portunus trituberculatus TaxID=210409 RepID=A0A5B7HDZ3_PORTR|nr:Vigilin [Portunus trituberculatus]